MSTYAMTTNDLDVPGDVDVTGAVTANSFSGDGSGLTGISGGATSINDLSDALVEGSSMYIGEDPSSTTSSASYNVSVGITALENITSGNQNVAVGYNALEENTTGERNVALGYQALENTTTGSMNTGIGRTSLPFNSTGDGNTALGDFTLYYNSTGDGNVAIGQAAGQNNTTGSNNVFIGKQAGSNSNYLTASDKLVIANSSTTTPLIDGDFEAATLKVNGALTANSFIPAGIGEKYIEITLDGVYGDGIVPFDLDAALGSNNPWYVLEALTVTEWDGNTSYFNIQLNVSDEQENTGGISIDYQSNRVRPRFYNEDNAIYTYSSNGQHLLTLYCSGRSSTIKVLFRVTSDWSN